MLFFRRKVGEDPLGKVEVVFVVAVLDFASFLGQFDHVGPSVLFVWNAFSVHP